MATRRTSWSAPITGEPNRIAPAQDGPAEAGPFFFCAVRSRKPEDPRRQKQHLTEDQVGQMQYLSFDHTFVTSSFLGADARYPRLLRGCGNGKLTPDRFRAATAKSEHPIPARQLRRWLGRLAFGQLSCALGQRFRRYPVSTALPRGLPRYDRRPPAFGALENMPRQVGFVHLRSPKDHCALRKTKIRWRINRKGAWRFQVKNFN